MDPNTRRTRSGRLVKPPERYVPTEKVEDDYASDEYDTDDTDSNNDDVPSLYSSEEEDEDDDSEGSLKDFVVPDDSESETDSESDS